jgi:hypothetical protein
VHAQSETIIKDTFHENLSAASFPNLEMAWMAPGPIDAPGARWQLASGDGTYEAFLSTATASSVNADLRDSSALFHNEASTGISLASGGSYVKPSILTVSADLSFSGTSSTGCCLLGFYSSLAGKGVFDPAANFTGLRLQKDGSIQLIENGWPAAAAGVSYTGKYDPAKPVTLSYTIDITKGTISRISLAGSSSTYSFTTAAFTDAATAFAGIGGQTDGTSYAVFNNLEISSGKRLAQSTSAPDASTPVSDSTKTNAP